MEILIRDPVPDDVAAFLERRRRWGADHRDEVWDGVLHLNPVPAMAHSLICTQLVRVLHPLGRAAGLVASGEFNLGDEPNFRVPDLGLQREPSMGVWHERAALVVEVLSQRDETFEKLPFYARHGVEELVIVEPRERSVRWLALAEGEYRPLEHSALVELGPRELAGQLDWPEARQDTAARV